MTGFKVYNENGSEQIGSQGFSLALSAASNVTLVDDGMLHPQPMVTGKVIITGVNPVLAFIPGGVPINVTTVTVSGSTFTFLLSAQSRVPINIPYWIFDVPSYGDKQPGLSQAGLKVYDQFGSLTFDAADSVFRIVGYLAPQMPQPSGSGGEGVLYETSESITVPSGRTYAVVQSLVGRATTMWSTGSYSNDPGGGQIEIPSDPNPPTPGDAQYKHMRLESYYSGATKTGSRIDAGLYKFENWDGWYAIGQGEHVDTFGQLGHTVIDVTDFVGGGTTTPDVVNVTVSPTSGNASGVPGSTTISNVITASASGGTGSGYQYTWEYVGGSTAIIAYGSTSTNTFRTQLSNQPAGSTFSATWRVKVIDSGGNVGISQLITFTHSAASEDRTPDSITLPTMNVSSIEHDVSWDTLSYGTYTVTGINVPITLRFERYDYSGNMAALYVDVYTKPPGGSWTHHGYYFAHSSGARYIDVPNVVNGTEVRYRPHGITDSGKRTATCRFSLWALESGAQFGQSAMCTFTVDSDDNYNNADYEPDLVNWSSVNGSTGDASFFQSTNTQTISGINRNIEIRATISNFSGTNVATSSRLETYVNGAYKHDSSGLGNGYWTHAPSVGNNTNIAYVMHLVAANQSQAATATYTVTVTNVNTGQTIDTFTVNQSVNSTDIDPNPISVPALTLTTDEPSGWTNTAELTISGINRPIVLRFTRGNQWDWGGIFTRRLYIYHSNNAGASWTEYFVGAGAVAQADITVNNGDWIHIRAYMDTNSGRGETSFTGYITNITSGGTLLASYSVSGIVDADNNYNVADYTPNSMSWPNVTWSTTNNVVYGAYTAAGPQITGINRSVQLQFKVISASSNTTWQNLEITNHSHNTHGTITNYTTNSSVNVTVANGDTFICKVSCGSDSGIRNTSATVQVINLSDGNKVIGTFNINVTVDEDNNYNIGDYSMNPMDFSNIWFDTADASYYTYNNYQTVSGINRSVTVSVQIANFNVSGPIQNSLFACQSQRGDLMTMQLLNGTSYMTVQNGDNIRFAVVVGTTGGRRSFSFDVYINNQDTGEFIDHHHVSGFFGSNPLTADVNTPFVSNSFFANSGINFQSYTNAGDVVLTVNGGVGNKTIVWEQYGSSWGSIWSYNGTTQPVFQYFGRTNYSAETMARAKVTDQAGNVAYSGWVTIQLTAGNQF